MNQHCLEKCQLCLKSLDGSDGHIEITNAISNKILEIFPQELVTLQSTWHLICEVCLEELKRFSLFRSFIIEKHQKLEVEVKIEYVPVDLDTFVIKTECLDKDTNCVDENIDDSASVQHEEVPPQSAASFSDDPTTTKQNRFRLVTCELCGKAIKLGSVYNHKKRFHTSDPLKFECDFCDRKFYKKDILAKHVMIHIPDEFKSRSFKCNACDQTFIRLNSLRSHEASKHATRKLQPVECHCGKTFKSKESLLWHNKRTHKRHEYERTCQQCGKIVPDSTALKSHIRVYHTEGGMCNFMCNVCGKFYHRQFELTKHEKSHEEKSFACISEGCGKKFLRIQQLHLHTKITHMNLKDFACSHNGCVKRFSTNQRLLRHIKISHENIREKCPVAGCAFQHGVRVSLLNHLLKHSELNRDDLDRHLKTIKAMKLQ